MKRERPRLAAGPPVPCLPNSLFLTALTALLLAGSIALARILLLLSGFLTAALLLSWLLIWALLAGVLTLLTGLLVLLLRHFGKLPRWTSGPR